LIKRNNRTWISRYFQCDIVALDKKATSSEIQGFKAHGKEEEEEEGKRRTGRRHENGSRL